MFEKAQKYIPNKTILSWLILIVSVFVSYSKLQNQIGYYISSDTLGVSGLFYDIFIEHGNLKNWYLASSPSLFPDLIVYFFVFMIFKSNVLLALMIYGFIQIITLVSLLSHVYKKIAPVDYRKYVWFIPIFISLYFLEGFCFSHDPMFGFFITAHCYHVGPFITTLLLLSVYLSTWNKVLKYFLIILLSILGIFSDKLFVVMFFVPFTFALLFRIKKDNWKQATGLIVCFIISVAIGISAYEYINQNKLLTFLPPHRIYDIGNAVPSLMLFLRQMITYLKTFGFRSFQIMFTFLSVIGCTFFYLKNKKKSDTTFLFFLLFYVFFCFSVFFAPIVNGNYTGIDTLRYNIAPFYLASIPFTLAFASVLIRKSYFHYIFKPSLLIILICISVNFSFKGFKEYINYYPPDVSEIDEAAKKHGLSKGISEYWTAKKTTLLSKYNIKVLSVYADGYIIELGNNITAFYKGNFDFVVANDLNPDILRKTFRIKDTIKTKQYTLLVVDKFIYPEGKYAPETVVK